MSRIRYEREIWQENKKHPTNIINYLRSLHVSISCVIQLIDFNEMGSVMPALIFILSTSCIQQLIDFN